MNTRLLTEGTLLDVEDLAIKYRRRLVVENACLTVEAASSVSIVGKSGSGKSSILAAIAGLVKPVSGSIVFDGHDVLGHSTREREMYLRHDISVVFQHAELLDDLEPRENVLVAALLAGMERRLSIDKANELLDHLGIPAVGILARDMSGGERQRLAVARALVTSPRLILADEPTGSLDAEFRDVVGDLILSIPERWGSAVLMVTHDQSLAAQTAKTYRLGISDSGPAHLARIESLPG